MTSRTVLDTPQPSQLQDRAHLRKASDVDSLLQSRLSPAGIATQTPPPNQLQLRQANESVRSLKRPGKVSNSPHHRDLGSHRIPLAISSYQSSHIKSNL
jgi:hypothetical protein